MTKLAIRSLNNNLVLEETLLNGKASYVVDKNDDAFELELNTLGYNKNKITNDFIYLEPAAHTVLDTKQIVVVTDHNRQSDIPVNWVKRKSYTWSGYFDKIKQVVASNAGFKIKYDTVTNFGPNQSTVTKYTTCLLISDTKILLVPNSISTVDIFDITTNILNKTTIPNYVTGSFHGCVRLTDDEIMFIPNHSNQPLIYKLSTNTFNYVGVADLTALKYCGGMNTIDGRILCIPKNMPYAKLFDPIDYSLRNIGESESGTYKYRYGCLTEDGQIVLIPSFAGQFSLYNNNTLIKFGALGVTSYAKYEGGILLPNGKILLINSSMNQHALLDINNFSVTPIGPTIAGGDRFGKSTLLPDGRIFCTPMRYEYHSIFDIDLLTQTNIGSNMGTDLKYESSLLLPDGRILCVPRNASYINVISASDGNYGNMFDLDTLRSAYFL